MNMLWIAGLSILVLLEKMMPLGRALARVIGVALFLGGGWMLVSELV
jgi:predicted metal-binding membrane protein